MEQEENIQEVAEQLTAEQLVANLENDVKAYTKSLEDAEKSLEDYLRQYEYTKKMWDILSEKDAVRKLNPDYQYETKEEWWELMEIKQADKIRQDRAVSEGTIKQFEVQIEGIKEAIISSQAKLDKFMEDD